MMANRLKQHTCIRFDVKVDKSTTKLLEMFCWDFSKHSLYSTKISEWYTHFKTGQVSAQDDDHSDNQ